jgi:hypothetical protein
MKTKLRFTHLEQGQVLPIVVISMLVMIMLGALMIDGGMIMSHRRTAQAAADAGALAGAERLCRGAEGVSQASSAAGNYVTLNNADVVGISFPQVNAIRVETKVDSQSFFARIFNQTGLTAGAVAEASCSPLNTATGVLPLTFPCYPEELFGDPVSESEICFVRYGDRDEDIQWHIDNDKMVIVFTTDSATGDYCQPNGPINCSYEGDERNRILIDEANRAWISLDGAGGANKLCDWINGEFGGTISSGTWLAGQAGVRANTFNTCLPNIIDDEVIVPIFNEFCRTQNPETDPICAGKWKDGDTVIIKSGDNLYYRIEGFAIFKVTCIVGPGNNNCPYRDHLIDEGILFFRPQDASTSTIEGYFLDGYASIGAGGGPDLNLYIVTLTK